MADVRNLVVEGDSWAPCFSKPFNDYEAESVEQFLLELQEKIVFRDKEDKVVWS